MDEGQERFSGGPCPSLTGPYLQVDPVRVLGGALQASLTRA